MAEEEAGEEEDPAPDNEGEKSKSEEDLRGWGAEAAEAAEASAAACPASSSRSSSTVLFPTKLIKFQFVGTGETARFSTELRFSLWTN